MGTILGSGERVRKSLAMIRRWGTRACAIFTPVARIGALASIAIFAIARRCRSSVVEHPLGKGEVVSSILTGSTTKAPGIELLQNSARVPDRRASPLCERGEG